jgi:hypothetical protein
LDDLLLGTWLYLVQKRKSMKWSEMDDLVLGRSFDLLVVLIKIFKNSYSIVAILVSMFGGCMKS